MPVAEQAGLSLAWSQTPEDRFSRDAAQIKIIFVYQIVHVVKTLMIVEMGCQVFYLHISNKPYSYLGYALNYG